MTIARAARAQLALQLRRLASGRITNDEFDDAQPGRTADAALEPLWQAGWSLYSDHRSYRLIGADALRREERRRVARCVLFLHSDLAYEWPPWPHASLRESLLAMLSFGLLDGGRAARRQWRASIDMELWPFRRAEDLERARRMPRYLTGGRVSATLGVARAEA